MGSALEAQLSARHGGLPAATAVKGACVHHCCCAASPCRPCPPHWWTVLQVWSVAVALYLVGTVVWNVFATGEKVFD